MRPRKRWIHTSQNSGSTLGVKQCFHSSSCTRKWKQASLQSPVRKHNSGDSSFLQRVVSAKRPRFWTSCTPSTGRGRMGRSRTSKAPLKPERPSSMTVRRFLVPSGRPLTMMAILAIEPSRHQALACTFETLAQ